MKQIELEIEQHWQALKGLAMSVIKDDSVADDVLQQSFLKALSTTAVPRSEAKILPWLKTIVKHSALDVLRKEGRHRRQDALHAVEEAVNDDQHFESSSCDCVMALLSELSGSDQELLKQVDIEGRSLKELSIEMQVPAPTLKVRMHRARRRLKDKVTQACRPHSKNSCLDCDC